MTEQASHWFDVQKVVAFTLIITMCAMAVGWMFYHPDMTPSAKEVFLLLAGGLISCTTTAVNYIFRRE